MLSILPSYLIEDDWKFILGVLEAEKVLVVQGRGFNWPRPAIGRLIGKRLEIHVAENPVRGNVVRAQARSKVFAND